MRFAYRLWRMDGSKRISPLFETPTEAGEWRRSRPNEHMTLTVYDEESEEELRRATPMEVIDSLFAMYA